MNRNSFFGNLLWPLIVLVIYVGLRTTLPTRLQVIEFWNGDVGYAIWTERVVILADLIIQSMLFGWITLALVARVRGQPTEFGNLAWIVRTFLFLSCSQLMFAMVFRLPALVGVDVWVDTLTFSAMGIWVAFSFPFLPIFLLCDRPLLRAIFESIISSVRSISYWFPWFLLTFLVSGGCTIWSYHLQSLSGYSFESFWYSDLVLHEVIPTSLALEITIGVVGAFFATVFKARVVTLLDHAGLIGNRDVQTKI